MEPINFRIKSVEDRSRRHHAVTDNQMESLMNELRYGQLAIEEEQVAYGSDLFKRLTCIGCFKFLVHIEQLLQCKHCQTTICYLCRKSVWQNSFDYQKNGVSYEPDHFGSCPHCFKHLECNPIEPHIIQKAESDFKISK